MEIKENKLKNFSIEVGKKLFDDFKEYCKDYNKTPNEMITKLIKKKIDWFIKRKYEDEEFLEKINDKLYAKYNRQKKIFKKW